MVEKKKFLAFVVIFLTNCISRTIEELHLESNESKETNFKDIEDDEPFIVPESAHFTVKPSVVLTEEEVIKRAGTDLCHNKEDGHNELFSLFVKGLNDKSNNGNKNPLTITIVGAGITGLISGILFKSSGHNVRILEASGYAGGRIKTFRNVEEEWHVEWGPMRFPRNHFFTQYLIHYLRLRLTEFHLSHNKTFYFIGGKMFRTELEREIFSSSGLQSLYNLTAWESTKNPIFIFERIMKMPIMRLLTRPWKEVIEYYDKYSFMQYVRNVWKLSPGLTHLIGIMSQYEGLMEGSFFEIIIEECIFSTQRFDTLIDGTDSIVTGILKRIESSITYNAQVNEINQNDEEVHVSYNCIGTHCNFEPSNLTSDYVIITPLPSVINKMRFTPYLSVAKRYALRNARIVNSVKVVLTFKTPFWERLGIKGGKSTTDFPSKSIIYPSFRFKGGLGVLLVSYTWGYDANRQEGMSDDDVIRECLYTLSQVHRLSEKEIRFYFQNGYVKKWGKDPNTLGAFAFFTPNYYSDSLDDLRRNEGRIFFGGDTTETSHGWIDGSIKSAVRIFREITQNHSHGL